MSLKINYNVSAMIANNSLKLNDNKLTTSLGKLSSGYKINSAKDDAAGLAISRRMHAQLKGLKAASQDAKDGVSVIEIADGALAEVHDILQRMNELSIQSANGTLVDNDRKYIQDEVAQLAEEIDRIGQTTEYNSQRLFTGEFDLKGYTDKIEVKVDTYSDAIMYGEYTFNLGDFKFKEDDNGELKLEEYNGSTDKKVTVNRPDGKTEEFIVSGDMYHLNFKGDNGDEFTLDIAGYGYKDLNKKTDVDIELTAGSPVDSTDADSNPVSTVTSTGSSVDADGNTTARTEVAATTTYPDGSKKTVTTTTTTYTDDGGNLLMTKIEVAEETIDKDGQKTTSPSTKTYEPSTGSEAIKVDLTGYGAMTFQIGANESQTLDIRFEKLSMESLGFKYQDSDETKDMSLNVGTQEGAYKAIDQITAAIGQISTMRSRLGACQNRLEHTETNLATSDENMTAAYSRIMDTDMAEEMSNYSNLQIVSQAATAILAQANERPSQMLQLLQ